MEIYANENDFVKNVESALDDTDVNWRNYDGLIVCGTHAPENVEEKIAKITEARMNHRPFLGICFGFQLMCIAYVRSAKGKIFANSTEIDPNANPPIIVKLNDPPNYDDKTARRVGMRTTIDLWDRVAKESFWHNYKLNNEYLKLFAPDWTSRLVYESELGESVVDILFWKPALDNNSIHFGIQYHPEYQSSPKKPHWVFQEFLKVAKYRTQKYGKLL